MIDQRTVWLSTLPIGAAATSNPRALQTDAICSRINDRSVDSLLDMTLKPRRSGLSATHIPMDARLTFTLICSGRIDRFVIPYPRSLDRIVQASRRCTNRRTHEALPKLPIATRRIRSCVAAVPFFPPRHRKAARARSAGTPLLGLPVAVVYLLWPVRLSRMTRRDDHGIGNALPEEWPTEPDLRPLAEIEAECIRDCIAETTIGPWHTRRTGGQLRRPSSGEPAWCTWRCRVMTEAKTTRPSSVRSLKYDRLRWAVHVLSPAGCELLRDYEDDGE